MTASTPVWRWRSPSWRYWRRIVLAGAGASLVLASVASARVNSITITPPTVAHFNKQYTVTLNGFAQRKAQLVFFLNFDSTRTCAATPITELSNPEFAIVPPQIRAVRRTFVAHFLHTDLTLGPPFRQKANQLTRFARIWSA